MDTEKIRGQAVPRNRQIRNTSIRNTGIVAACIFFLAFCLFISLKSVFGMFSIDEDSAESLMLWYGAKAYGLQSIPHFEFTPDNWLLSVVPLNFFSFFLFGPKPELVIFSGWLSYVLSALISACIAWELQAKRAAFGIAAVLSCLGFYALNSGFAAYAASHNITNTYGLFGLLLTLKYFTRARFRYLPAITGFSAIAAISDPWMLIAYELPLLGLTLLNAIRPIFGLRRADSAKLALAVFISACLSETKLFGLFNFIPGELTEPARFSVIKHNAIFFIRDLGGMLNLFPNQHSNALLPAIVSLLLIAVSFCLTLPKSLQAISASPPHKFFTAFAGLSTAIMAAFFIVMNAVAAAYSARFILNILYLAVICFAVTAELGWGKYRLSLRAFLAFLGAAFFTASLASIFPVWASSKFLPQQNSNLASMVSFFEQNGWDYGYGPYHGSHSNAVTAASGNIIKLRPVMFDPQTGMIMNAPRFGAYDQWMTAADFPANAANFFVFLSADSEECQNLQLCKTGLLRQFGKPVQILQTSPTSWIYLWPRTSLNGLYSAPAAYGNSDPARGRAWDGEAQHPKHHSFKWLANRILEYISPNGKR